MSRKTVKVLQRYLVDNNQNIVIDGYLGNQTIRAIDALTIPPYLKIALKEVGTKEIVGKKHSSKVLAYHSVSGGFTTDEVPWCGSYVNWVMLHEDDKTVSYPARAKSWLSYGQTSVIPITGSIAVKSRRGGGHVCFVIGKNKNGDLYCLGGNQNDEVNIRLYPKSVFMDFRVPNDSPYLHYVLNNYNLTSSSTTREA